jgi:hypothetical protein
MEIMSPQLLLVWLPIINKRTMIRNCLAIVLILSLCSCGSTSVPVTNSKLIVPIELAEPTSVTAPITPLQLIQQAELEWQQHKNTVSRNTLLLAAADSYSVQQECSNALTIISHIVATIANAENMIHANLVIAECSSIEQFDDERRAQLVSIPAATNQLKDRQKYVQAQLLERQRQWLAAAQTLVQLSTIDCHHTEQIWRLIQRVNYRTQQASIDQYPNLRLWLLVSAMVHEYGTSPQQLTTKFNHFAAEYPDHPLAVSKPKEFVTNSNIEFNKPTAVAVILPLTGRLEVQGNAIKQGVLSAYFAAMDTQSEDEIEQILRFYDSNSLSIDQLAEQLQEAQLIIGPLLKQTIQSLTPKLPMSTSIVALNRIPIDSNELITDNKAVTFAEAESGPLPEQRFYFALAPEDEARQMAEHLHQQGYRNPILVHPQDTIGKRLAEAFLEKWRNLAEWQSDNPINLVSYGDNDAMRDGILAALDVTQSKNRIKQLERVLIPELYNVPRNRRDVDAIVAFATPEQTELLTPIVESSLSPFNDIAVPVYVSSRSISLDITKNQLRDLQNVYFLDLPWMMPENTWQHLSDQVNALYPNQRDSSKRLFALGFDAYSQINALPHLAAIPQLTIPALTGELSVNQYQQVVRRLPIAVIDNEKVKVLVEP